MEVLVLLTAVAIAVVVVYAVHKRDKKDSGPKYKMVHADAIDTSKKYVGRIKKKTSKKPSKRK